MDQFADFVEAELLGALAEDEEHGIDYVGFAGAIGADYGGEAFVEGADGFGACVGFEVFQDLKVAKKTYVQSLQ